jgi:hypothetical protein
MMCLVALFLSPEYPIYCHADSRTDKMRYFRRLSVKYAGDTWHRSQYNQGCLSNINHKEARVRNNKKYWVLLLGLIVLLLSSAVGCGQPGFTTYNNDVEGYTISYPLNWKAEVAKDATIFIIKSPSLFASVRVDVISVMPAQQAAQRWITAMGTGSLDFALLENKPMEGFWNWYVSYDYEAESGRFHGEAYFKSTADHVYKLDTAADLAGYKNYPFSTIISSFKLQ